jgi:fructose-specific phosphotransferase system IIC component
MIPTSLSTILFFNCPVSRLICKVVQYFFNISPPVNVSNRFGNWLNRVKEHDNMLIRIIICALSWDI